MRKRPRRLWLGDWQRDEDPALSQPAAADRADTVTITPEEPEDVQPRTERRPGFRRAIASAVAIAIVCAFALALFSGGDDKPVAARRAQVPPAQAPQAQAQPQTPPSQVPPGAPPQGFGGPDLTGAAATKAAEAAVAKYPGDIERVTRGPGGGGYVVHVIQPDGNEVHVVVDDDFNVQGSDAGQGPSTLAPGRSQ